jgi:hypothetical protein
MILMIIRDLSILAAVLVLILFRICHRDISFIRKCIVFYIWFVSFTPIVLVHVEMTETYSGSLDKLSPEERVQLKTIWQIYYWLNFFNGWVMVPLMIGYLFSGFFSVRRKLIDSIVYNAIFYLMSAAIVVIAGLLTIDRFDFKWGEMLDTAQSLYNSMWSK